MRDAAFEQRPAVLLVVAAPWIGVARVPRVLHDAGCHVVLMCNSGFYAAHSAYIDELLPAPKDVHALLTLLKEVLAARRFDWVVLGDGEILGAAVEQGGSWRRGWFPIDGDHEAARLLVSKTAFARVMTRAALPIPRSEATTGAGAAAAAARIGYPVIVKPDQSSAGRGIFRADSEQQLGALADDMPVAIQEFVTGCDEPLFIELNGRPPPWLHLHRQFGVDFPGAIRAMLSGSPHVVRPPPAVPEPRVRMFPQDAMRAAAEGDWFGFVRGYLGGADAPRDEPRLLRKLRGAVRKRAYKRMRG
jgi:hypothetical protein